MHSFRHLLALFALAGFGLAWSPNATAHPGHGDAGTPSAKAPRAPTLSLEDMIRHESATWEMGISTDREVGDYGNSWLVDQQPRHEVETDAFYLDKHEVTVREFALFLTYAGGQLHYHSDQPIDPVKFGYLPEPETADEPIRQVTWRAARDYCEWAGKRLPTEAEWEFAATGPNRRTYPWGDDGGGCEYANYFVGRSWCADGPLPVGSHPEGNTPNGVADMGGNVAEWVHDWYGQYPDEKVTNPTGPEDGEFKVIRGGGFVASGQFLRSQARRAAEPERRAEDVGFRCAADGSIDPSDVNGPLRGNLSLPPDTERETEPRFPGEPVSTPDRIVGGLNAPSDMVRHNDTFYVIESGTDSLLKIDPSTGDVSTAIEEQTGMQALASNGQAIFIAVRDGETPENGEILELTPDGSPTVLAANQTDPGPIVASGDRIVWGTDSAIVAYDKSADTPSAAAIVSDTAPVHSLEFVSSSQVAYGLAKLSNSNPRLKTSEFKLGIYDFSESTDSEILPGDNTGNIWEAFYVSSIAFDSGTGQLWTTFRQPGFPRHGYLCGIGLSPGAPTECLATHTPPKPDDLIAPGSDQIFWTSQRSVVTYVSGNMWMGPATYKISSTWTAPRGLLAYDNHLYWLSNRTGRLLRTSY